jgi:hypothetical protein
VRILITVALVEVIILMTGAIILAVILGFGILGSDGGDTPEDIVPTTDSDRQDFEDNPGQFCNVHPLHEWCLATPGG